jgi:hypothetical protein
MSVRCDHLDLIEIEPPETVAGCADCLRRHARRHSESSGHPIVRSAEPGEDWYACFVDDLTFRL